MVQLQRAKFRLGLDRKNFVLRHIRKNQCSSILEIGVFNGNFAKRMIAQAKKSAHNKDVTYYGIDLFEKNFTPEIKAREVAVTPKSAEYVYNYLAGLQVNMNLLEGYSSDLLPTIKNSFDLILIDGGHSYETVKKDLEYSLMLLTENGAIILDDITNDKGVKYGGFGVNQAVSEIDRSKYSVEISWNRDFFLKSYGVLELRMAKIQRKTSC